MSLGARISVLCAALLPAVVLGAPEPRPRLGEAPPRLPEASSLCTGEYADFLSAMNRSTRLLEASPDVGYTYLVRNTATYERVYYAKGGKLRRLYLRHVRHGTAFAYLAQGGSWFVATNAHVAEQPAVTESDEDVEGVPVGARKVRETVRIVANESDPDELALAMLTKVVVDEELDLAILRTQQPLKVMPYKLGRSSALRVGNAVQVRGYPLGAVAAANSGRVISVGQLDHERSWNHEDFAVDALLNAGNSGSPVLAVSCKTGDLELVGIYHAGYREAQALNVVVAVDQLRETLETMRPRHGPAAPAVDRAALIARVRASPSPFLMPFAERVVRVDAGAETVRFSVLEADYPLTARVELAVIARTSDLGRASALVLPPRFGEREIPGMRLEPTFREQAVRLSHALWKQLAAVVAFRELELASGASAEGRSALAAAVARIRSGRAEQKEVLQSVGFDAEDLVWPADAPAPAEASSGRLMSSGGDDAP